MRSSSIPGTKAGERRRRRRAALAPSIAAALAVASLSVGVLGYVQTTSEPSAEIEFVVAEGLPDGVTQDSVEAAAEGISSDRPFTLQVVDRPLSQEERQGQDTGGTDVVLSVQETQVGVHGGAEWDVELEIIEALASHDGPEGVAAAAQRTAELQFSTERSPVVWASWALILLLTGLLVLIGWRRARLTERSHLARLSAAQHLLAGVVLELDALDVRFHTARTALWSLSDASATGVLTRLEDDHRAIHDQSLQLARDEIPLMLYFQVLERPSTDSRLDTRGFRTDAEAVSSLEEFDEAVEELKARADALVDAAELRSGHAASASVVDGMAGPLISSVDEVLRHRSRFPRLADELEGGRDHLLALTEEAGEATPSGGDETVELVNHHADLLERWDQAERQIADVSRRIQRRVSAGGIRRGPRVLREDAARRVRERVNSATAGARRSRREYREALGLPVGPDGDPVRASERALEKIQRRDFVKARDTSGSEARRGWTCLGLLFGPIAAALLVAWLVFELPFSSAGADEASDALFLLVALTAWLGICATLLLIRRGVEAARSRVQGRRVRGELEGLRDRLQKLALGLDLSRLDLVAVLGADSLTGGRAEEAGQRLHESGLATAWREIQALERLPRSEQRGEDWESRVVHVEKLIDTLTARDADVSVRAEALLRSQREG